MGKYSKYFAVILSLIFLYGCAGSTSHMRMVPENEAFYMPDESHAFIIFMRPSTLGFAIQSSVFDITTGDNKLVGIVSAKKKVAYKTKPGEHLFMVIGESADFMKANLEAGKTYYSLVTPRMGAWKARFSFKPIKKEELDANEFKDWLNACQYYENTESSYMWAEQNAESIQTKREKYWPKWEAKSEEEKPLLRLDDGQIIN